MEEKAINGKISLTGKRRKVISSDVYTLKVPNFFTLPEYDDADFKLNSPPFEFANATWRFRCESCEKEQDELGNWIKNFAVYLLRLNSAVPSHIVFYGIVLFDSDDEQHSGCNSTQNFHNDNSEGVLFTFENDDPSFDILNNLTLMINLIAIEGLRFPENERRTPDKSQEAVISEKGAISLSRDFKDILLNGQDYNLTFNVRDKKFRAHQDILRARSEVFCSMLTHDMMEKNSGVINVPDCDPLVFEQLLCYVYTGRAQVFDENNVFGLYYVADKYHLPHLNELCCDFITSSLTVTNMCNALDLAFKHSDSSLLESVSTYFFNNLDDVLTTEEWQQFMKENSTAANDLIIKSVKKLKGSNV